VRIAGSEAELTGRLRLTGHLGDADRAPAGGDSEAVLFARPATPAMKVRAYSQLLGEYGMTLRVWPALARDLRPGLPRTLDGAPALKTGQRIENDAWTVDTDRIGRILAGVCADVR